MVHYGVTKAAWLAPSRGLAETTAGTGVTVNTVLAGPTAPEGVGQFVAGLARSQGKPNAEAGSFTHARPPGKELRSISLMSGGEKSRYQIVGNCGWVHPTHELHFLGLSQAATSGADSCWRSCSGDSRSNSHQSTVGSLTPRRPYGVCCRRRPVRNARQFQ